MYSTLMDYRKVGMHAVIRGQLLQGLGARSGDVLVKKGVLGEGRLPLILLPARRCSRARSLVSISARNLLV